jgi:hypothetical protein
MYIFLNYDSKLDEICCDSQTQSAYEYNVWGKTPQKKTCWSCPRFLQIIFLKVLCGGVWRLQNVKFQNRIPWREIKYRFEVSVSKCLKAVCKYVKPTVPVISLWTHSWLLLLILPIRKIYTQSYNNPPT